MTANRTLTFPATFPPSTQALTVNPSGQMAYDRVSPYLVGDVAWTFSGGSRPGFLGCDGKTIGNASSGATARANADTQALFDILWVYTQLPLFTSAGSPTSKGATAAADFAANRQIALPDFRGRSPAALDSMGGTSANVDTASEADWAASSSGAEFMTQTVDQMPIHSHPPPAGFWIRSGGGGLAPTASGSAWAQSTATEAGGGQPMRPMNPRLYCYALICYA